MSDRLELSQRLLDDGGIVPLVCTNGYVRIRNLSKTDNQQIGQRLGHGAEVADEAQLTVRPLDYGLR